MTNGIPSFKTKIEAALFYRKLGWPVFPIKNGKVPRVDWKRLQTELPARYEIRDWWTRYPNDDIAIVTGEFSKLVVVDVDPKHGGTTEGLPNTGIIARTPSGGWHYYYTHPGGVRIKGQVNADTGRDVRADGGYAVASPSGRNGNLYQWQNWNPAALGNAPEWALEKTTNDPIESKTELNLGDGDWISRLILEGAKEGERNKSAVRLAGYFAGSEIPRDVCTALMNVWNERLDSPLPDTELNTTIKSAYKLEAAKVQQEPQVTPDEAKELLPMVGWTDFMVRHGGMGVRWLVKDWIPEGTIGFVISPPQCYKTYLSFDLAISVASGTNFLGQFPVERQGKVAVFQQEDPHGGTAERMALISSSRMMPDSEEPDKDTIILPGFDLDIDMHEDAKLRFDKPEMLDALELYVAEHKPALVIIDPFYSTVDPTGDEFLAKAAFKLLRLKAIRDRYPRTSFLIIHHTKKDNGSWDRQAVWGSQFLNAYMETSWILKKPAQENSVVVLRHTKVRGEKPFMRVDFDINFEEEPQSYAVRAAEIASEEAYRIARGEGFSTPDDNANELQNVLVNLLHSKGPLRTADIAQMVNKTKAQVSSELRAMMMKQTVTKTPDSLWCLTTTDDLRI